MDSLTFGVFFNLLCTLSWDDRPALVYFQKLNPEYADRLNDNEEVSFSIDTLIP